MQLGNKQKADGTDRFVRAVMLVIATLLGIIAIQSYVRPEIHASADVGRFDYVNVVSPAFLYKGAQGVLLLDKRNGNVWFVGRGNDVNLTFRDPVFVAHLPLDKLDQAPQ